MKLHREHLCKVCDTACLWCKGCGWAHCFNGHDHEGFEGPDPDAQLLGEPPGTTLRTLEKEGTA